MAEVPFTSIFSKGQLNSLCFILSIYSSGNSTQSNSWIKRKDAMKTLTLTVDDIIYIEKHTKYKEDEIRKWFR